MEEVRILPYQKVYRGELDLRGCISSVKIGCRLLIPITEARRVNKKGTHPALKDVR